MKVIIALFVLVAVTSAQHYGNGHHQEYQHHPQYNFAYAVKDTHTHDIKHHNEHRDGDKTEGEYSLFEPDGTTRTVKYHVHGKSGFVATVHRSGHEMHSQPEHRSMMSETEKNAMHSQYENRAMHSQYENRAMNSQSAEKHASGQQSEGEHQEEYHHSHPQYNFAYAVKDTHTHDIKHHNEHRDGDKTEGEYSLVEPDGTTRTVKYHVHGKSGFVATVHRSGHAEHPQVEKHAMYPQSEKHSQSEKEMESQHEKHTMQAQPEPQSPQKYVPMHPMVPMHYVHHAAPIYYHVIPQPHGITVEHHHSVYHHH